MNRGKGMPPQHRDMFVRERAKASRRSDTPESSKVPLLTRPRRGYQLHPWLGSANTGVARQRFLSRWFQLV
jgi:hypothetical protein